MVAIAIVSEEDITQKPVELFGTTHPDLIVVCLTTLSNFNCEQLAKDFVLAVGCPVVGNLFIFVL